MSDLHHPLHDRYRHRMLFVYNLRPSLCRSCHRRSRCRLHIGSRPGLPGRGRAPCCSRFNHRIVPALRYPRYLPGQLHDLRYIQAQRRLDVAIPHRYPAHLGCHPVGRFRLVPRIATVPGWQKPMGRGKAELGSNATLACRRPSYRDRNGGHPTRQGGRRQAWQCLLPRVLQHEEHDSLPNHDWYSHPNRSASLRYQLLLQLRHDLRWIRWH